MRNREHSSRDNARHVAEDKQSKVAGDREITGNRREGEPSFRDIGGKRKEIQVDGVAANQGEVQTKKQKETVKMYCLYFSIKKTASR